MDKRDIILRCLDENWPVDVLMIGDDLVKRIVDDAILGIKTPIRRGQGGFNFDLTSHIETIVHGASVLLSLVHIFMLWHMPPPYDHPSYTPDHTEPDSTNEENLVNILVDYIREVEGMEPVEATRLAHLLIRVISDGR